MKYNLIIKPTSPLILPSSKFVQMVVILTTVPKTCAKNTRNEDGKKV